MAGVAGRTSQPGSRNAGLRPSWQIWRNDPAFLRGIIANPEFYLYLQNAGLLYQIAHLSQGANMNLFRRHRRLADGLVVIRGPSRRIRHIRGRRQVHRPQGDPQCRGLSEVHGLAEASSNLSIGPNGVNQRPGYSPNAKNYNPAFYVQGKP
jgi:hypothetical protein